MNTEAWPKEVSASLQELLADGLGRHHWINNRTVLHDHKRFVRAELIRHTSGRRCRLHIRLVAGGVPITFGNVQLESGKEDPVVAGINRDGYVSFESVPVRGRLRVGYTTQQYVEAFGEVLRDHIEGKTGVLEVPAHRGRIGWPFVPGPQRQVDLELFLSRAFPRPGYTVGCLPPGTATALDVSELGISL